MSEDVSASGPGGAHRRPRARTRRVLAWTAAVLGAALVLSAVGVAGALAYFNGRIDRQPVFQGLAPQTRPSAAPHGAENFLLVGSDTRQQPGDEQYQAPAGSSAYVNEARSDTVILAHLSASRDRALLVSFPRDSWVELPDCRDPATGKDYPAHTGMFNAAYTEGGATCTIKAVESLTGVRVDHYLEVDFSAFKNVVDTVGGVPICVPEPLSDRESGLDIPAGRTVLHGEQALAFVRARYVGGPRNGSDLARIDRQKQFLAALLRKATSTSVLLRPDRLIELLSASTGSVRADTGLSVGDIKDLALAVHDLDPSRVTFLTVPIDLNPGPKYAEGGPLYGRVKWDDRVANALWSAIRTDSPLPTAAPLPVPSDTSVRTPGSNASGTPTAAVTGSPSPLPTAGADSLAGTTAADAATCS